MCTRCDSTPSKTVNGKTYTSHLLRHAYRDHGKVRHRTIANLTGYPAEEIAAIRLALEHKGDLTQLASLRENLVLKQGLSVGGVFTSDFLGPFDWTWRVGSRRWLFEAKIELQSIEPRNPWVHILGPQLVGQALILAPQQVRIWGVVVSDHDPILDDTNVSLQSSEDRTCQVLGIPMSVGLA